jgi:hypothetical protein
MIEKIVGNPNASLDSKNHYVSITTPITINASDSGCCLSMTVEYRIWNVTSDTGWMNIPYMPYTFFFTEKCTHNLSIRAYDCLGDIVYHPNQTFHVNHMPKGESAERNRHLKNLFFIKEDVYALGSGFKPFDWIDIYVTQDKDWTNRDPITPPADVSRIVETAQTDSNGDVHLLVWPAPLIVGRYDIIYDANQNGFYDWGIDAVDGASPGFNVITERATQAIKVPTVSSVGLALLTTFLTLTGIIIIRRRQQ